MQARARQRGDAQTTLCIVVLPRENATAARTATAVTRDERSDGAPAFGISVYPTGGKGHGAA